MQVGEVAAAASGNQYFLANSFGSFQDSYPASPFAGLESTHESGSAPTQNDCIEDLHGSHAHCKYRI